MPRTQVYGLNQVNAATDAASCLAAACAQAADVYQWCPGSLPCGAAAECWVGAWSGTTNPQQGWISGRRNTSAPLPTPPEVAPAFPDGSWTVLDLPHGEGREHAKPRDGVREGAGES